MIRRAIDLQFVRFVLVGGAVTILFFVICYVLRDGLQWSAFAASLTAYGLCLGIGYLGQRHLAFRSKVSHRSALLRYTVLQVCAALFVSFGTEWATRATGMRPLYTSLFATGLSGMISFAITGLWVFREPV